MNYKFSSKIWILITLIILIVFVSGGIFAWQYWWVSREETKIKLTPNAIQNAEYSCLYCGGKKITLKNGSYEEGNPDEGTAIYTRVWNKPVFGDLDNDGKEDAAVILSTTFGGSGDFRELAILISQNRTPNYLTSVELGDLVIIKSVAINSGIITIDMITHGSNDPHCCPTQEKVVRYKLIVNQLKEITEDATADWKTYTNDQYGFEFKYPRDWYLTSNQGATYLSKFLPIQIDPRTGKHVSSGMSQEAITIIVQKGNYSSIDDWFKQMNQEGFYQSKTEVTLGAEKGYKAEAIPSSGMISIILYHRGKVFIIDDRGTSNECRSLDCSSLKQILSTFRFFEKKEQQEVMGQSFIKVISPNGGEKWGAGKAYAISWDFRNVKDLIITLFQSDSRVYLVGSKNGINASLKNFQWKIDKNAPYMGRNDLRIALYDAAYCGYVDESTGIECVKDENTHSDISENYFSVE